MEIKPESQIVENCLGRKYYIDFYQREYIWSKETVKTLLDDIFHSFETSYEEHKSKGSTEEVTKNYNWYYLNIYITNTIGIKEYIVDGQQRLTTLTLIAVKLLKLCSFGKEINERLEESLKKCIRGNDKRDGDVFWIEHEKRNRAMSSILNNKAITNTSSLTITEKNIIDRYEQISKYFDDKKIEPDKIKAFIFYFLEKLVLVELKIEKDDTPMVFEVINDRGEALKPFEILKGKLIGALEKEDIKEYNEVLWEKAINNLEKIEDSFFGDYLKSKFIFRRESHKEALINNQYHRYIFANNEIADSLKFRKKDGEQKKNIKNFIKKDLKYYSDLYVTIRKNEDEFLQYNNEINKLSGQYQNILAACKINDENKDEKIKVIAKEIDRLYVVLQLNRIYDSNEFQEISYQLNEKLANAEPDEYKNIFNELIENQIKERLNLDKVTTILDYDRFKNLGYGLPKIFLRYLFARVEKYLCESVVEDMKQPVHDISSTKRDGYHVEHILSRNEENIKKFANDDEFEDQRNRIGGLLLLQGVNNISSGNEIYQDKIKTYSNGLYWGRTLSSDCYHSNVNFNKFNSEFKAKTGIEFKPIDNFDKDALEYRTKLLYQLVKIIWSIE